ncbi:Imidazolonepropionase [Caloramator quimbayensis]|uniref:Imidazolonepropionase n=1 Tax=Caloramator quimbayensis TaxID=1147123 RepID=A0A1T4WDS5_9CLOT|nr:amidohydrolase [Caloramator quimbayensis]SKA75443.1 Imidazolonepropionase [Caloramator quimbayensis]
MILIKNGTVLTMAGKTIENGEVLIDGGKILKVGKNLSYSGEVKVLDADGGYIMPGIIDAHCHIGMWEDAVGFEGADGNEATDPATPHLRAIDAINPMDKCFKEAYENGVTCVCTGPGSANVIGGTFTIIKTKGKRVDDMIVKEPAAMKVAFGENPKSTYDDKHQMPTTRMAIAAILRDYLYRVKDYMKAKKAGEKDEDDMPDFDIKMESLIPVIEGKIPLKAHAHRADDIFTAIRIAKEFNLKLTLDHCTEGHLIAKELSKEGYPAIVGPSLTERSKIELRELTFETASVLSKEGVKIALMTDHPVIPVHYLPLCAALAVKAGLDENTALCAITINPAQILGVDDRVGSIEEGKDADIAVFDRHPLDIQSKTKYVLIDGKIAFER